MQVTHLDACSHTKDDVQEEGHVHLRFDACAEPRMSSLTIRPDLR